MADENSPQPIEKPCWCPLNGCQAPWHKILVSHNGRYRRIGQVSASATLEEMDYELLNCYQEIREREEEINQLRERNYRLEQLLKTQCRRFEALAVDSLMSFNEVLKHDLALLDQRRKIRKTEESIKKE